MEDGRRYTPKRETYTTKEKCVYHMGLGETQEYTNIYIFKMNKNMA